MRLSRLLAHNRDRNMHEIKYEIEHRRVVSARGPVMFPRFTPVQRLHSLIIIRSFTIISFRQNVRMCWCCDAVLTQFL